MGKPTVDQKVALLRDRFCHQTSRFAWQWHREYDDGTAKGGYAPAREGGCLEEPPCGKDYCKHRRMRGLDDAALRDHVKGRETVGIYQLGEGNTITWIALDVDINDARMKQADLTVEEAIENAKECIRRVARVLQGWRLPFLVEFSGSKGYHAWIFLDEPVPAAKGLALARWVHDQVAIPPGIAIELFPKQVSVRELGSLVKLPLGIHRKTRNPCGFVGPDLDFVEDQWATLWGVGTLDEDALDELIEEHGMHVEEATGQLSSAIDTYVSLPCHVKLMQIGPQDGMRDVGTFKLACYLRAHGLTHEMAFGALETWARNDPNLDSERIGQKLDSAFDGNYSPFPCSEPLFDPLCSSECRFYQKKLEQRGKKG